MRRAFIKGQNLIEYALVVAIVVAALTAMSTYVYRATQAKQQDIYQAAKD